MKAKQWAERFQKEELQAVLKDFILEIDTVAQARGATPLAYEGAAREQETKFVAVCGLTGRTSPKPLFRMGLKEFGDHILKKIQLVLDRPKSSVLAVYPSDHPATKKREEKAARRLQRTGSA